MLPIPNGSFVLHRDRQWLLGLLAFASDSKQPSPGRMQLVYLFDVMVRTPKPSSAARRASAVESSVLAADVYPRAPMRRKPVSHAFLYRLSSRSGWLGE
jgi:hypothetical protein